MATLALHYDLDAALLTDLPSDDEMTGLMIDHAELLGWSQGFDPEDRDSWTWQVNEMTRISGATGLTYSVQVSLPHDRPVRAPWAGITTCAQDLLGRWFVGEPAGYSFAFDATVTAVRQSSDPEFFDRVPVSPGASVGVSFFAGQERPGGVDLLDTVLAEARGLVIGPSSRQRNGMALETGAPPLPEFHGTPWEHVAALDTHLREWSPLLVGSLASTVMFTAAELRVPGPLMIHLRRTTTPTT
ncbi:hypothetical protein AABM36_04365 [Kocuria sp. KSNUG]|uniref:hypothetical protein n=1 Tax=Kocuria TaxID=57493 RepID=UPI003878FE13